jgi:trehalose-phosphatase
MRELLGRLAQRFSVAVISGRDRPDLAERVGLTDIYYAGSHGLDIAGPGTRYSPPGAAAATRQIQAAAEVIARDLQDVTGVVIEHKRYSAAVHYRQVDAAWSDRVIDAVTRTASAAGLRVRSGKQVRELVPDVDWHKGRALTWLRDVLGVDAQHTALVYVGDDETDEDAFRALGADGIGLRPGSRVAASLADYHLADVAEVHQFLQWLLLDPVSVRGPDHEA